MFITIEYFEKAIADFYGAPYAVSTDCCTHAIELCMRLNKPDQITIPTYTYISIPFTAMKLGVSWQWRDDSWHDYYYLGNTNIVDAAVYWKEGGYIPGTLMCLSFQFKKHLSLGRGGAILCENKDDYIQLKKMSYDGRMPDSPWAEQDIETVGYHYYMTPETAQLGLDKLDMAKSTVPKPYSWKDYPHLPSKKVFNNQ